LPEVGSGNETAVERRKPGDPGVTARAVKALVTELAFPASDPRAVMTLLATQLAEAVDEQPGNVTLARELRMCVANLSTEASALPGQVDAARVQYLQARVRTLIGGTRR
jgi:hypothetical protein